jgi:hypothetical protein
MLCVADKCISSMLLRTWGATESTFFLSLLFSSPCHSYWKHIQYQIWDGGNMSSGMWCHRLRLLHRRKSPHFQFLWSTAPYLWKFPTFILLKIRFDVISCNVIVYHISYFKYFINIYQITGMHISVTDKTPGIIQITHLPLSFSQDECWPHTHWDVRNMSIKTVFVFLNTS